MRRRLTAFEKAERAAVMCTLARADGNFSVAARALGIGRATRDRGMKRLRIGENRDTLSQGGDTPQNG